jgi:hypothetical protein
VKYPAESLSLAGAVAILLAHLFASLNDATTLVALTVVVGAIPGAVTWIVNLVRGRQGNDAKPG